MFTNRSKDDWYWSIGFNLSVDFSIWVLEQDGLQVSPFTKYPASLGNQQLAKLGLGVEQWRTWFYTLIENETTGKLDSNYELSLPASPAVSYTENDIIKAKLDELWQLYLPISNSRRYFEQHLQKQASNVGGALWNELKNVHKNIPVRIILTGYPYYIEKLVAPSTIILAPGGKMLYPDDIKNILLQKRSA